MEQESDSSTNCNWITEYNTRRIDKETGGVRNKRTNGDHTNCGIVKIGQNTEKSPGNLRRLVVTQTPGRNHQRKLV